ncbi:MAG: DegT/DnrJ/EryC1/StrS family aminotransferase [Chloroflexi bacterium]|nr:DegT/DnrJ/EryC1/StrS family aminotransferase [Chloroflexota bacterium]
MGRRAHIIPGQEPELKVSVRRIPVSELDVERGIVPVCEPMLMGNEAKYVLDCLQTNWISSAGKYIPLFEEKFSRCCHTSYGVACTSGTTALHLAMAALGVGPEDEVIVPTFTMIATANAVTYTGAKPVLVDSEMETWNMDPALVETRITPRTKAIMPIHTYGHPADMDALQDIAQRHGLYLVEDAAEAHGAEYKGRRAGSLSDVACFSFYANKIITTGEGGMLTTNNPEIAAITRNLRDHAFSTERHFWHKYVGFNYRMTNVQAAIGLAQTEHFDDFVALRRNHALLYNSLLRDVPGLRLPPEKPWAKNVFWMYGILVEDEFGISRDELRRKLAAKGIETRTFFIPIHLQPIYFSQHGEESYPVAEELCRRGMYLPSASSLKEEDIHFVVECVRECAAARWV